MPKNSDGNKFNKVRSLLQKQGQHQDRGGQRDRDMDRGMDRGNANDNRQPDREQMPDVFNDRQGRRDQMPDSLNQQQGDQQPGLGRLLRNAKEFRRDDQGRNMNDGTFNDGNARANNCLSRVLMLALPLVAMGTYLFVR